MRTSDQTKKTYVFSPFARELEVEFARQLSTSLLLCLRRTYYKHNNLYIIMLKWTNHLLLVTKQLIRPQNGVSSSGSPNVSAKEVPFEESPLDRPRLSSSIRSPIVYNTTILTNFIFIEFIISQQRIYEEKIKAVKKPWLFPSQNKRIRGKGSCAFLVRRSSALPLFANGTKNRPCPLHRHLFPDCRFDPHLDLRSKKTEVGHSNPPFQYL